MSKLAMVVAMLATGMTLAMLRAEGGCPSGGNCHSAGCPHGPAHECVLASEMKEIKKTVYDVKWVPVCEHRPSRLFGCGCCPVCQLKYKKVLIKQEITVCRSCGLTCVPQELPCGPGK